MSIENQTNTWEKANTEVFWGEIAPCDHLVQIYDNDDEILSALEDFADGGFKSGESVIIIATESHLEHLNKRLQKKGYDLKTLQSNDQYLALKAPEVLSKFMVVGWPSEELFNSVISDLISRARGTNNRKIRAYGEMVAILWGQGYNGATVQLEHLWNKLCKDSKDFSLFCAYPKSGFTQDIHKSIDHICSMHTKVIAGDRLKSEIHFKNT